MKESDLPKGLKKITAYKTSDGKILEDEYDATLRQTAINSFWESKEDHLRFCKNLLKRGSCHPISLLEALKDPENKEILRKIIEL